MRWGYIKAANVKWKCAQFFVNVSCGKMPRDNRCDIAQ